MTLLSVSFYTDVDVDLDFKVIEKITKQISNFNLKNRKKEGDTEFRKREFEDLLFGYDLTSFNVKFTVSGYYIKFEETQSVSTMFKGWKLDNVDSETPEIQTLQFVKLEVVEE